MSNLRSLSQARMMQAIRKLGDPLNEAPAGQERHMRPARRRRHATTDRYIVNVDGEDRTVEVSYYPDEEQDHLVRVRVHMHGMAFWQTVGTIRYKAPDEPAIVMLVKGADDYRAHVIAKEGSDR